MTGVRRLTRATLIAGVMLLAAVSPAGANVDPGDVEDEVVCIQCGRPLSTSSGAAADDERAFIADLAAQGLSKEEIKQRLVDEYGERVLVDDGSPIATAAPWIAGVAGLGIVALVLVRRGRGEPGSGAAGENDAAPTGHDSADSAAPTDPAPLSDADHARIDAELAALEE